MGNRLHPADSKSLFRLPWSGSECDQLAEVPLFPSLILPEIELQKLPCGKRQFLTLHVYVHPLICQEYLCPLPVSADYRARP